MKKSYNLFILFPIRNLVQTCQVSRNYKINIKNLASNFTPTEDEFLIKDSIPTFGTGQVVTIKNNNIHMKLYMEKFFIINIKDKPDRFPFYFKLDKLGLSTISFNRDNYLLQIYIFHQ